MTHFVHLNVHSHYSRGWGTACVEALCAAAARMGMRRIALTDTNGLYGMIPFIQAASEQGLEPIVGSELIQGRRRALALIRNAGGYSNLCRILSDLHCHENFDLPRSLLENREGLIVISDDFRLLQTLKREGRKDLFVEMSPGYGMATCHALSRRTGIPPVATNRVYFLEKKDFALHRILRAVAMNSKLSRLRPHQVCREHNFLNTPRAMTDQFPHTPQALSNTVRISEACLRTWNFQDVIFPRFQTMDDREAFDLLHQATLEGCRRRYGKITDAIRRRIDHEMKIIRQKNFAHYFLVVADITRRARGSCGRGSAAASIVAYALEITHVDPIRHNLFFERFLNPGRRDPPDIDIDFAWDERDEVLDYVFSKYGARRTAMVANHNTLGARAAIRETAKVFGLTDEEIGRVTRKIGFGWKLKEIRTELARHPKMRDMDFPEPWDEILRAAARLEGCFDHLSTHCGGVVVVPDEIRRYCPVEISAKGPQVLQWDKDGVEDAGLVKIDILGNRSLAVIRDALRQVEENHGRKIRYARLDPVDDRETVRIFYEGNTFGVFYFESPATRRVLTQVGDSFDFEAYRRMDHFHLNVVVTSIIRPASNQSIRTWISRLRGRSWRPPHPLLRPVLDETLGVMVFQEQLSQAAIHLAGFDPAEADDLRKVVSKKHRQRRLRDFHARFVEGARSRGVPPKVIADTWEKMMGFDGYSFCKPHSASYTLVAYKSAYLRAHYPAEFMAAVISNGGGYYSTFGYLSEARRMGLRILPPDINQSRIAYTGRGREIRIGLMQIKGLCEEAREAVVHERMRNGPFSCFEEFLDRAGPKIRLQDLRVLIKAGCFDELCGKAHRPALLWRALRFYDHREEGQRTPNLFSHPRRTPLRSEKRRKDPEDPGETPPGLALKQEMETLGFLFSVHPLAPHERRLGGVRPVPARDLGRWVGRRVTTVGWQITGKTVHTKEGEPMKFVSFEDRTGMYEAVFFPGAYRRFCHMLNAERPYLIKGRVEEDLGAISVNVMWIDFLDGGRKKGSGHENIRNGTPWGQRCGIPFNRLEDSP